MTDQNQPLRDVLAMLTAARHPSDTTLELAATAHLRHETRQHLATMIGSAVGIITALAALNPGV